MVGRRLDGYATVVCMWLGEHGALGALQSEVRFGRHSIVIGWQLPPPPFGHAPIDVQAASFRIRILGSLVIARNMAVVIERGLAEGLSAVL